MTTDLEKNFFSTFGIESKKGCTAYDKLEEHEADVICNDECSECLYFDDVYPCITDRILLELICILNTVTIPDLGDIKIDRLRKTILEECIVVLDVINTPTKEEFINDIRTLFKEDSND